MIAAWRAVVLASIVASSAAPGAVAEVYWSTAASGCFADSAAMRSNRYSLATDTSITFRGGETGTIILVCGVARHVGSTVAPDVLGLAYRDSTGTGTAAGVQAELVRVDRQTGARTIVASVASDSSSLQVTNHVQSAAFNEALDFTSSYYHVRVALKRGQGNQDARAFAVMIESLCGNGDLDAGEMCEDGNNNNLDGCSATCQVEIGSDCGNNIIEGSEECDGAELGGASCSSVDPSNPNGFLACTAGCTFDTSGCTP
jgi:cysteine-rich repeat protein